MCAAPRNLTTLTTGSKKLYTAPVTIVSNREPYQFERSPDGKVRISKSVGGLVSALDRFMSSREGRWIAWAPTHSPVEPSDSGVPYDLEFVPVSKEEVRGYYKGVSNRALWPICHYFVDRGRYDPADWVHYRAVNRRFAETVVRGGADQLVWVHDYHLCLAPAMVRELGSTQGIIYFHHIPFPAPEVFRVLPWREDLLRGLLGADLIGFHTRTYAENFLSTCRGLPDVEVDLDRSSVRFRDRTVRVDAFPIGVDVEAFERLAADARVLQEARRIREAVRCERIILGVDRLDYTKGILERLTAFDHFLTEYPQRRGRVTLVQFAVPSRTDVPEYRALKRQIEEAVGRINGKHGTEEWQPIYYAYRKLSTRRLVAHYLAADIVLVTPLRDGMNLVVKEYCATRIHDNGVVILSELTGAAECLGRDALIVNPYAHTEVAEALEHAVTMPGGEQRARMQKLRERIKRYDIYAWVEDILSRSVGPAENRMERAGATTADFARRR
jgi:trehalose 6-phosphate synthase